MTIRDIAQEFQEEFGFPPNLDFVHSVEDSTHPADSQDLPPRPESRMDFVPGSTLDEITPSLSHKRTPSATVRWTREILKKIRLSTSGSSSSSPSTSNGVPSRSHISAVEPCPSSIFAAHSMSTSGVLLADEYSSDEGSTSGCGNDISSSISSSSSLSSSSSNSWSQLDNISVSLSSSSDESDCSSEDSDEDSHLDLGCFEEVDLGDGFTYENETEVVELVSAVRDEYVSAAQTRTTAASTTDCASSFSTLSTSVTESTSDTSHAINSDLEETPVHFPSEPPSKYTCLPSPLSLFSYSPLNSDSSFEPSTPSAALGAQPQRHLYAHRGCSRLALHYRKWFWATREEDWRTYTEWVEEYRAQQEAYAGMSDPTGSNERSNEGEGEAEKGVQNADQYKLFPSLFSSARDAAPNNRRHWDKKPGHALVEHSVPSGLPPLTIHPRWGDLGNPSLAEYSSTGAYTDTWCTHTDRYLLVGMRLGLWTIRKVLWLFEMKRICGMNRTLSDEGEQTFLGEVTEEDGNLGSDRDSECLSDDDDIEEGQVMHSSVVSLASLISSAGSFNASDSDDSDVTLVESDSDSEPQICSSASTSALVSQADAHPTRCSVDFDKTCSSLYEPLDENEGQFEDIDLSLEPGSSSGLPTRVADDLSLESETTALFRTLYLSHPTACPASMPTNDCARDITDKSRWHTPPVSPKAPSIAKRSWYEQCELLLVLTGARATSV